MPVMKVLKITLWDGSVHHTANTTRAFLSEFFWRARKNITIKNPCTENYILPHSARIEVVDMSVKEYISGRF